MEAMMTSTLDFTAGGLAERFVHWLRPRVDLDSGLMGQSRECGAEQTNVFGYLYQLLPC
jgi:hypothetical protein